MSSTNTRSAVMAAPDVPLDQAIATLPARDRDVVVRRYLLQEDVPVIATALGISEWTARNRISRATARIRNFFAAHGTPLTAAGMIAALESVTTPRIPPALAAQCASLATTPLLTSGVVSQLVGSAANTILFHNVKLAAAFLLALGVASTITVLASTPGATSAQPKAPDVPRGPMTLAEATDELHRTYALAEGQHVRVIDAPFTSARQAWVNATFPYAKNADRVRSVGFNWPPDPDKPYFYMSYVDEPLTALVESAGLKWYEHDATPDIPMAAIHGDLVRRTSAAPAERLASIATIISERRGRVCVLHPVSAFVPASCCRVKPGRVSNTTTSTSRF